MGSGWSRGISTSVAALFYVRQRYNLCDWFNRLDSRVDDGQLWWNYGVSCAQRFNKRSNCNFCKQMWYLRLSHNKYYSATKFVLNQRQTHKSFQSFCER